MARGTMSVPQHVQEGIENHDPQLSIEWNPVKRRYEVLRLKRGYSRPRDAYSTTTGRRRSVFDLVFPILRDNGTPRSPDWRDVKKLKNLDTWRRYTRAEDFKIELRTLAEKEEDAKAREREEIRQETLLKPAYLAAIGREQVGWKPKGER